MKSYLRTPTLLAMAVALSVVSTSCSGDDPGPRAAPTSSPTASPSEPAEASPSPTLSETEQAAQDVEDLVRRYFEMDDAIGQDPAEPLRQYRQVMSGGFLQAEMNFMKRQRADERLQIGSTQIRQLIVDSVTLDGTPTAYAHVCWDVTDIDVIDPQGRSVIVPGRADRGWTNFTVTNTRWDADPRGGWRISGGGDMEKEPCAG